MVGKSADARSVERGEKSAAALGARFVQLDVTDDASVSGALATVREEEGLLDVLVHNAGVLGGDVVDGPEALRVFDTNAVAIVRVTEEAATMVTVQYAKSQPGIKFNELEPGFTATDMTAAFGVGRAPEVSARTVVRLATSGADGPTGTFQDEGGVSGW
ncbi:SDR family oxidoreductase [Actinosynnema sp. NPDC023794]